MNEEEQKRAGISTGDWKMFRTSKRELGQMLVDRGKTTIKADHIRIRGYPFRPSTAYKKRRIFPAEIENVDVHSFPPTIKIGTELIFIPATEKEQLAAFAAANHVPTIKRDDIWGWLLEPFLDTEYTDEHHQRISTLLSKYGLDEPLVARIRQEVAIQMFKYNFDTTLWDWVHLGAYDALFAMLPKYGPDQYSDFYNRVMQIALLPDQ